ncbi:DUF3302 domain-containing protein [Rhizobium sp. NZLR1b]|uniref:DUF3302 domain-containing protein n=1 Tax=Rhizobium sp. NZLR1b TaxID=2731099 RepID=UPI001C833C41|nr:DUF3302 domain-containing protein [Rhizobium sp. NZLR1b]MBX5168760.1 DUF3302 domain-containing protein [Rhizobium sp. NZLR1b]
MGVFAWIALLVLVASTVAVVVFLVMLPGMIAKKRNHPWAQAVTVGGWVTLLLGFALWPVVLRGRPPAMGFSGHESRLEPSVRSLW